MKNEFYNEKNGLEYVRIGEYYIPKIAMVKQEKVVLNKYGRLRLQYLKKHKSMEYREMRLNGTLNSHLKDIQETAQAIIGLIIEQLKQESNLTEDMKNTNQLYWVGTMNAIKEQAEEIVCSELIFV